MLRPIFALSGAGAVNDIIRARLSDLSSTRSFASSFPLRRNPVLCRVAKTHACKTRRDCANDVVEQKRFQGTDTARPSFRLCSCWKMCRWGRDPVLGNKDKAKSPGWIRKPAASYVPCPVCAAVSLEAASSHHIPVFRAAC